MVIAIHMDIYDGQCMVLSSITGTWYEMDDNKRHQVDFHQKQNAICTFTFIMFIPQTYMYKYMYLGINIMLITI